MVRWKLIVIVWLCNVVGSQKKQNLFEVHTIFISAGVEIKDGPFANNDLLGNVKFRQDRIAVF